ncbi:urea transporter [Microvirga sp. STS02]|uniref:urea transporter n=1 Tax=Hymenobacter negativus TaxID=2795026 RepID=UPI0018DE88CB|nr:MULTISPECIES: urea transporter [Bacteria]MBH8568580.1 urea transporter [Hymenobacter negativus]MBR7208314.1 urea transporter [Microvirga sp. STS02]
MPFLKSFFRAVLHSYAMLFFSQHRGFAAVLLAVSFGRPVVGAAGLASTCLAVAGARLGGFNREWTDSGAYSFNALLTGLALASFFAPGWGLAGLVVVGAGLALLLSVALGGWLGGRGLPFLSLPFVGTVWLLLLGAGPLLHLSPAEGGTYWLNEAYALGGPRLVTAAQWVGEWPWPPLLATYLHALSAVLFQDSALAGLLVAAGLLWHSRIAFALSVLGFLGAYGLLLLTGPAGSGPLDYNLGANYVVAAMAVGGVFVIPSAASYGWALLSVPVTVVALAGFTAVLDRLGLPALSLPYCATALLFLYVLLLRERPGAGLVLTPIQRYSPERNLYAYATARVRLAHQGAVALTLPFRGAWTCTQGYLSGGPTHLGDWGQALDFAITDADGRTYHGSGLSLSDYYAYNKPVLAPADGVVEEVIQHIEDNAIGEVNTRQNWGNTVVLRHAPGLFTQLSHLRAHSVPVKVGDYVRRGDIIGTCGSSGRSPEPHLHFQVQATPYVGSRTVAYPLAYFVAEAGQKVSNVVESVSNASDGASNVMGSASNASDGASNTLESIAVLPEMPQLRHFAVPTAGEVVRPPAFNRTLSQALRLPPGYALAVRDAAAPAAPAQRWEVFTDAYNLAYLRCQRTGAVLYFAGDESVFYCTAFYGDESSWLYLLYQAAYRVPLVSLPGQVVHDEFPLTVVRSPVLTWAQDVLAPFYRFLRPTFWAEELPATAGHWPGGPVRLRSRVVVAGFGRAREVQASELLFTEGRLAELRVRRDTGSLTLTCTVAGA